MISANEARQNVEIFRKHVIEDYKKNEIPELYQRIRNASEIGETEIDVSSYTSYINYSDFVKILQEEFEPKGYVLFNDLRNKSIILIRW